DCARSVALARFLLANGCDGLNVLGTTGEATSFSLEQRKRVMTAYRDAGLPLDRLMVGTGAAAVADAVALTRHAAALGFGGALVLPPFYYKGAPDDGLVAYVETIVTATAAKPIPVYLYHFPAQSGLPWHVRLVERLIEAFGTRLVGLKDSSGDMAYAREMAALSPRFDVFPSTEAVLMQARSGMFAGCISATANLNADLCARAWRSGDAGALDAAVAIRKLFDGKPLVPGAKALLAHIHRDAAWARSRRGSGRRWRRARTAGARQPRRARRWPQRRPKRARNGCRGRRGLTAAGGKPPLARKASISRDQPIVCRVIPIDRAASTSRLPAVDAPRRGDYKRLSPPLAFYDIGTTRGPTDRPQNEHSHAQHSFRPQGGPQDRAAHRDQQGAPFGDAQLRAQGRGSDRERQPQRGTRGAARSRT